MDRLVWVIETLSNQEFLEELMTSPAMNGFKENIITDLGVIMGPILDSKAEEDECKFANCTKKKLTVIDQSRFRLLGYCANHHRKMYLNMQTDPSPRHFLTEDVDYPQFVDVMTEHCPANIFPLSKGCRNYVRCAKKIRRVFAHAIWDKYFGPKATHPVDAISQDLRDKIQLEIDAPSVDLYNEVQACCQVHIDRVFRDNFLPSKDYVSYMAHLKLPDYLDVNLVEHTLRKSQSDFTEQERAELLMDVSDIEEEDEDFEAESAAALVTSAK